MESWKLLNGTVRYKDLSGLVLRGAYVPIGKNKHDQSNWIFQGKSENISDSIIDRINNYTPKKKSKKNQLNSSFIFSKSL